MNSFMVDCVCGWMCIYAQALPHVVRMNIQFDYGLLPLSINYVYHFFACIRSGNMLYF